MSASKATPAKKGRASKFDTAEAYMAHRKQYANNYNKSDTAKRARALYAKKLAKKKTASSIYKKLEDEDVYNQVIDMLLQNPAYVKTLNEKIEQKNSDDENSEDSSN
jgi:hypothetical protein